MIISWIAKTIAAFNSNSKPAQLAWGISLGVLLALIPANNLLWFGLFVLTLFLKVNQSLEMVSLTVFKLITLFIAPLLDSLGFMILTASSLRGFF